MAHGLQVLGSYTWSHAMGAATETKTFTVSPAPVNVSLTPSSWYAPVGTGLTFSASVAFWSAGPPKGSGTIAFNDGSVLLATIPVDSTGHASFTTSNLTAGSHNITATFLGADNYASGSASATIALTAK
jgi:hypothetical protein